MQTETRHPTRPAMPDGTRIIDIQDLNGGRYSRYPELSQARPLRQSKISSTTIMGVPTVHKEAVGIEFRPRPFKITTRPLPSQKSDPRLIRMLSRAKSAPPSSRNHDFNKSNPPSYAAPYKDGKPGISIKERILQLFSGSEKTPVRGESPEREPLLPNRSIDKLQVDSLHPPNQCNGHHCRRRHGECCPRRGHRTSSSGHPKKNYCPRCHSNCNGI